MSPEAVPTAAPRPVGAWLVGARGSVATTAMAGAAAIAAGLAGDTGMVTVRAPLSDAPLTPVGDLVFGGHDLVGTPLDARARGLAEAGVLPAALARAVAPALRANEPRLRPGIGAEGPARARIARVRSDLEEFRAAHDLEQIVVVNLASVEAPAAYHPAHGALDDLDAALDAGLEVLPPSSLYAYAALDAGCAWVDFTPAAGARLPALDELARRRGVPHAGSDGKTGETLLKTVLAPMFAERNLRVRSWTATNILGGGDGAALADPERARGKLASKGRALDAILGYPVEAPVGIGYVEDMGEWKTAWDHISFEGFLGTRMRMQFTWEGCDSALAAPLVLDLVRLAAAACACGRSGALGELAFFFKDPAGADEHRLAAQYAALCDWAARLRHPVAAGC